PLLHLAHYGLGQVFMRTKRFPLAVVAYLDARAAFRTGAAQALQDETAYQRQLDDQIRAPGGCEAFVRGQRPQDESSGCEFDASADRYPDQPAQKPASAQS